MRTFSLDDGTWTPGTENNTVVNEASTLQLPPGSCMLHFDLEYEEGAVVYMKAADAVRDRDGDVQYWRYQGDHPAGFTVNALIFND